MKIRWTPEALRDRDDIWAYIAANDLAAAIRLDERFSEAAATLADFPLLGQAGRVPGTRELLPHETYRLVYEIADDTVWMLAIVHAARLWPPVRS